MRKLLLSLATIMMFFSTYSLPVMAEEESENTTKTSILTTCEQASDGTGCLLQLTVDIMSIGIGILGVIGITVVGIQYLNASGDETKTRKAKHRILEIVIGLVIYITLYAIIRWLLPIFNGA